jgi:hypothetical protein
MLNKESQSQQIIERVNTIVRSINNVEKYYFEIRHYIYSIQIVNQHGMNYYHYIESSYTRLEEAYKNCSINEKEILDLPKPISIRVHT